MGHHRQDRVNVVRLCHVFPIAAAILERDTLLRKQERKMITSRQRNFHPEFVHNVYFWLKNPADEGDRSAFLEALRTFLATSQYARTCFIGMPPQATRDVVDGSFTFSLVVSFESAEAQSQYQTEDAHTRFVESASKLWEKVVVYDSIGTEA